MQDFGSPAYGISRNMGKANWDQLRAKVETKLKEHGFGVLTEIDVQATLKKKIDVDRKPYLILGACNPSLAHQAISAEPGIGLLLPCNVVMAENDKGEVVVSAIDPVKMFELVDRPEVAGVAKEVKTLLTQVVEAL